MKTAKIFLHSLVGISMVFYTLAIALLAVPSVASAQVPTSIGYSGRLFNASGTALSGTYYFWFDLEDALTLGSTTASNIQGVTAAGAAAITVTNGFFTLEIPVGTDLGDFTDDLYLEMKVHTADAVASAETLSPRVRILKNPYSVFTQAVQNSAADPSVAFSGEMYYDTDTNDLKWYNGTSWLRLASNLDTAYNNFGATASKITVDAAESQTGGLEFELSATNNPNLIFDTQGTGDVIFQDAGTAWFTISDGQAITSTGSGAISLAPGAASNITTSAGDLTLQASAASVNIVGVEADAAAILLDANNNAAGGIDIDAGTGGVALDTTGAFSIDGATASNVTVTGSGISLTLAAAGGGAQSLVLNSAGTGTNAIDINATAGGVDVDAVGVVTIDAAGISNFSTSVGTLTLGTSAGGTSSSLILSSADTSSDAILLDVDGSAGSGIYLDAYDSATNTTGVITLDGASVSINSSGSSGIALSAGDSGPIAIATTGAALSITGGGTNGTVSISSTLQDVTLETVASSRTIGIGASNTPTTRTINMATGSGTDTVTFGDATGSDQFNLISGESTNDIFDVTFASLTTADAFDIDTAALTTGDVFDITYTGTTGSAIRITDSTAASASSMILMANTAADVTAQTYLIQGTYTDTADAEADFLLFADNAGDAQFAINTDGNTVITGTLLGTDALTLTAGDILVSSGNFDLTSGDFNVGVIDAQSVNIDGDGSPTADILSIGVGDTSATDGVDALLITSNISGASGTALHFDPDYTTGVADNYSVISVDAFTAATTANVASAVKGLDIGNLTQTENTLNDITATAVDIGTGWDVGLAIGSGGVQLDDNISILFGTGLDTAFRWDTTDANANEMIVAMPEGDGTNVPVYVVGDASIIGADLGFFNGVTDPTIAIVSDDGGDYARFSVSDAGILTIDTVTAGSDIVFTPVDEAVYTLAAGGAVVIDAASTDSTETTGVINLDVDSSAANVGIDVDSEVIDDDAIDTQAGAKITMTNSANDSDVVYGLQVAELGGAASGGNEYAIYQAGTAWDLGLKVEDAVDIDGSANIADTTAGSDVAMGNATGNLTFLSDNADFGLTDATDNVFQLVNATNSRTYLDVDAGAADTVTLGNSTDVTAIAGSATSTITLGTAFTVAATTGATIIAGSAEGTAALTLTAGDVVLTDGDITLTSGQIEIPDNTASFTVLEDATGGADYLAIATTDGSETMVLYNRWNW
ncbi:hypothetical protein HYV69_00830 [Candidatus Uhrbacteria bacterium]|nr:hypothetical protein [Candidatus Uhrbacteria bacterium]